MKVFHHSDMDGYCAASLVMAVRPSNDLGNYYKVNYEPNVEDKFNEASTGEDRKSVV